MNMAIRNYLIEGVSGAGKTSVATELQYRGYQVVHGDRELAYKGDPVTGEPIDLAALDPDNKNVALKHMHHVWNVEKLEALVKSQTHAVCFYCGGSRNFASFIDLFDAVFVLVIDAHTLNRRLAMRPEHEFGGKPEELEFILRLHRTKEDIPHDAILIDATQPLNDVVDEILLRCHA